MVNYKANPRVIKTEAVTYPVNDQFEIIQLDDNVDGSNAADGFHEVNTGVIYQVATGKKFRMIGLTVRIGTGGAASTLVISSGDTENAETSTLLTIKLNNLNSSIDHYAIDKELVAGKFLTYNPSGTDVLFVKIIGYEF